MVLPTIIALLASTQEFDSSNSDFIPEPLPAWVDSLSLRQDYTYVNSRKVTPIWNELMPAARVGDITRAIASDVDLFIQRGQPLGQRPRGNREVLDGGALYTLTENGFRREISVNLGNNSMEWMMVEHATPEVDGRQFLAWKDKFTAMWGEPTVIIREEAPKERTKVDYHVDRPYAAIEHPRMWGQNHITMAWVWGSGKPLGFRWEDLQDSLLKGEGPTFLVVLVYAEESTAIHRASGRKQSLPRLTQILIDPYGVMAG